MVTVEWDIDRTDGVTLVSMYVTATRACQVRVENQLQGPVWPPRRRGQPAAGWSADGYEGIVTAGDRLVGGYATPATPDEPPVALTVAEPIDTAETGSVEAVVAGDDGIPTVGTRPAGVVRALGSPLVPRDAVPIPEADGPSPDRGVGSGGPRAEVDRCGGSDGRLCANTPDRDGKTEQPDSSDGRLCANTPDRDGKTEQPDSDEQGEPSAPQDGADRARRTERSDGIAVAVGHEAGASNRERRGGTDAVTSGDRWGCTIARGTGAGVYAPDRKATTGDWWR
jgi:hypothetical protein